MKLWSIKRDGTITDMVQTYGAQYGIDYISADKSEFPLLEPAIYYERGDFVYAKGDNDYDLPFFGVVDSYENKVIMAQDLLALLDFDFPATKFSGDSFEQHMANLIKKYVIDDVSKNLSILNVTVGSNTKHTYQPAETPTATNLMKYMINGFKKYNVVWRFDRFENGKIYTVIEAEKNSMQIKDNLKFLQDWDVSTTEVGNGVANKLLIVNKTMKNSESPAILDTWYLTQENEVVHTLSDEVIRPTVNKVWVYDTTEEDKPTYEEVANSELKGNYYSHEISFVSPLENRIFDASELKIGLLSTIIYEGKSYKSVMSGYQVTENTGKIEVRFGNVRSRLSELLE